MEGTYILYFRADSTSQRIAPPFKGGEKMEKLERRKERGERRDRLGNGRVLRKKIEEKGQEKLGSYVYKMPQVLYYQTCNA